MAQIYVSIGTNIDRKKHLKLALDELHRRFGLLQLSPVYQSEAVGFEGEDFFNMVAGFVSNESIESVVKQLKSIEKLSGRDVSAPKFSARTLDIDLLNYDDVVCEQPIQLPRDEITYNAFVLKPLNDVAPQWIHPVKQRTISALWKSFDQSSQRLNDIEDPIDMTKYKAI